jgi:D-serine deaminase-like pyridoxal phosphate-dependent protein
MGSRISWEVDVKTRIALAALVVLTPFVTSAKDPPSYEKGQMLSMDSTTCGLSENGGKSVTGEILGTDSSHKKTQEVLCQEYVLQADHIVYRIRPRDDKHPVLLPVGEMVQFRISKDKLYLRVPEGDQKERQYQVVSMRLREDAKSARNNQ